MNGERAAGRRSDGARPAPPRAVGDSPERSPGEAAWRWHLQLEAERLVSPIRAAVVAVNVAVWVIRPHAPGTVPGLAWTIAALACLYAPVDLWLVYRHPHVPERFPSGSAWLDLVFVLVWITATGRHASPFVPLFFLGALSAPLRLPPAASVATTLLYGGAYALFAPPSGAFAAAYVVLAGLMITAWSGVMWNSRRAAMRDPLTGCFTREYALFHLDSLFRRKALPFAVLIVDLDDFKAVNDRYGHAAGDAVLAEGARILAAHLGPEDVLARYGGDEFVAVLPGADAPRAALVAERLRAAYAAASFPLPQPYAALQLTLSVGVAEARPGANSPRLIASADRALYRAKHQRDRVDVAAAATP